MNITEHILQKVADIRIPGFFITVEFSSISLNGVPDDIESFLKEKHQSILSGVTGRKFVYRKNGWKLTFTFFPTDQVVDERYALKNKVQMQKYDSKTE